MFVIFVSYFIYTFVCVHVFCLFNAAGSLFVLGATAPKTNKELYYVVLYYIISYHVSYRTVPYRVVSYRTVSCRVVSYHIIYYITLYYIILYYIILYYIILYYIILYYIILYYIILYYIVLYYIILYSRDFYITHNDAAQSVGLLWMSSARRRDLYLITHNTHNKYPCPRRDSNPQFHQVNDRKPTP